MDPSTQAANKSHHSKQAGAKADKRNLAERKKKEERGENVEKRKDPRVSYTFQKLIPDFLQLSNNYKKQHLCNFHCLFSHPASRNTPPIILLPA